VLTLKVGAALLALDAMGARIRRVWWRQTQLWNIRVRFDHVVG